MMIGVKNQKDPCDGIHHGGWMMKVIYWCLIMVFTFFLPNELIILYESASKFGSGLFLCVQVVLLLDFVHKWNDTWVGYDVQFWYIALFVVLLVCYVAAFGFSALLFHWFTPSGQDCGKNTFFIVMTLIFAFVFAIVALHPAVNGSILHVSVISLYCMYLCYSGNLLANQGTMNAMAFTSIPKLFPVEPRLLNFSLLFYPLSILLSVPVLLQLSSPLQVLLVQGSLINWGLLADRPSTRRRKDGRSHQRQEFLNLPWPWNTSQI